MSAENKELVRNYFVAISGQPKTIELINQYVDEQPLRDHILQAETGFPQYVLESEDMIAEGDQVAVKARLRGTHLGTFNGIPATGRNIDVPFHITYRINKGKIIDHWLIMDSLVLLQQLGVMTQQA